MSIFRKKQSSFSRLFEGAERYLPRHELLFQLRRNAFDEDALQCMNSQIQLLQWKGFHTEERELKEEIPNEYAGILTYLHEGKLECQKYLKLQEEYGGRKKVCFYEISPTNRIGLPSDD